MPLDDLVQVIETLQQRIRDHGDSLRQNEIRTRVALIDPLLRALGWDVADPGLVTAEYDVSGQRADYALLKNEGGPAAFVEAKKLGESLISHRMQMVNYANMSGVPYAGLTDGNNWELYVVFDQKPLPERLVLDVYIANLPAYQCALKFLLLWRPNLGSGQPVNANESVFAVLPAKSEDRAEIRVVSEGSDERRSSSIERGWLQFSNLAVTPGEDAPAAIKFPTGEEYQIRIWRQLVEVTISWLWNKGFLSLSDVPVRSSSKRFLVNAEPKHPAGNGFKTVCPIPGTPLYIDGNISARASASNAKRILQLCGQDPASVGLKFN